MSEANSSTGLAFPLIAKSSDGLADICRSTSEFSQFIGVAAGTSMITYDSKGVTRHHVRAGDGGAFSAIESDRTNHDEVKRIILLMAAGQTSPNIEAIQAATTVHEMLEALERGNHPKGEQGAAGQPATSP